MTRRQHELGMFQLKTSGTPGEGAGYEKLIHWLKTFSLEFLVYWTWKNILCPPLFHSWVFLKDSVAPGGRQLFLPEFPFWWDYNVRSRKNVPLQVHIAKLTPWHALLVYPFCWIQISTGFPAFFLSSVPVFKKCYYFTLGRTVILLLRGSLQWKPGFLWCIPKCLGETIILVCESTQLPLLVRETAQPCIADTRHAARDVVDLFCCCCSAEICFTMCAITRLESVQEVVVNIKH